MLVASLTSIANCLANLPVLEQVFSLIVLIWIKAHVSVHIVSPNIKNLLSIQDALSESWVEIYKCSKTCGSLLNLLLFGYNRHFIQIDDCRISSCSILDRNFYKRFVSSIHPMFPILLVKQTHVCFMVLFERST